MATKLNGCLNLSRIPRELIKTNQKGEKVVWIDVIPNKNGADQYGNTHAVTIYNKEERKSIYLANLREQEFGQSATQAPKVEDLPAGDDDSLPF